MTLPRVGTRRIRRGIHPGALLFLVFFVACSGSDTRLPGGLDASGDAGFRLSCDLRSDLIFDGGVARDAIPALVNPVLVTPDDPGAAYLDAYAAVREETPFFPDVRVVGLEVDDEAVAIPHNILWWHEIVNIDLGGTRLAVTYCPLTGSALVFDATRSGSERFGVSGLVYMNNLMMFDAETGSLWPQLARGARCGSRQGTELVLIPTVEMRWEAWKDLHPNTLVVSSETGFDRNYIAYPYDLYEMAERFLLFPMDDVLDFRRPLKERVLGLPHRDGGMSFPFGELRSLGDVAVVTEVVDGRPVTILWDGHANTAMAYEVEADVTLSAVDGRIMDWETGSQWSVRGVAVSGSRHGEHLRAVDGYVAFWFAWAAFQPKAILWTAGGSP